MSANNAQSTSYNRRYTKEDLVKLQANIQSDTQVYVFGYPTCPYSAKARGYLTRFNPSEWTFVSIDWNDNDKINRIRSKVGNRTFPVVFIKIPQDPSEGQDTYEYIGGASELVNLFDRLEQLAKNQVKAD